MSAQRRAAANGADRDDAMFPSRLQLCFESRVRGCEEERYVDQLACSIPRSTRPIVPHDSHQWQNKLTLHISNAFLVNSQMEFL
eukprot:4913382-Amphidinium_carterae.1